MSGHVRRYIDGEARAIRSGDPSAPSFCACCVEERKGLTPVERPSKGATGRIRILWLCVDCLDMGEIAELAQCDIRERGQLAARRKGNPA